MATNKEAGLGSLPRWRRRKEYQAEWRRKYRQRLVDELGGVCAKCGTDRKLEFHHARRRTWITRDLPIHSRLARYKHEIAEGVIELLCRSCNAKAGRPEDPEEEPF